VEAMRSLFRNGRHETASGGASRHLSNSERDAQVRTRPSESIATILIYTLAILLVFQGIIMLFPITSVTIARDVISKDRRRRKREIELAQVFPDVWVQHITRTEGKMRSMARRELLE
jgi:predicted ABC-type exoprotein transport system permease subunit